MLLEATWLSQDRDRNDQWRFRTPLGPGTASLEVNAGRGSLVVSVDVEGGRDYIEPRRYTALGALAFCQLPEFAGMHPVAKLSLVPTEWAGASQAVVGFLSRAGLRARIVERTIEIESQANSPSALLKRTGLALFALDSFARSIVSHSEFIEVRTQAIKAFSGTASGALELFEDHTGERALRGLLSPGPTKGFRYVPPSRPILSDDQAPDITTELGKTIRVDPRQWRATADAFSHRTVDPRWLIYVPHGMCSVQTEQTDRDLEHPQYAFGYYMGEGIRRLIVEYKHMGSRAIAIVCRDRAAAARRFGATELGSIYTRNGRPFFDDPTEQLDGLRERLSRARFWEDFETDWVCLDGEYLPWTLKAERLLEETHGALLENGEAYLKSLERVRSRLPELECSRIDERSECFRKYHALIDGYRLKPRTEPLFAPFQVIATEGREYFNRGHKWHMQTLHALVRKSGGAPFIRTPYQEVRFNEPDSVEKCLLWWEQLAASGEEGLVIKAPCCVPKGRRGLALPALKCRTPEHLRLVYGPDYDLLDNRWKLASRDAIKRRREKHRRIQKQLALSVEGVQRFLQGALPSEVENCVRAVLSLEKEYR